MEINGSCGKIRLLLLQRGMRTARHGGRGTACAGKEIHTRGRVIKIPFTKRATYISVDMYHYTHRSIKYRYVYIFWGRGLLTL